MTVNKSSSEVLIGVILTDKDKRIQWVNEDFVRMTGYRLEELKGQKPSVVLQGEDTEPQAIERMRDALKRRVPVRQNVTNYRKNGEAYLCQLVIHPLFDDHTGQLTHFLAFETEGGNITDADVALLHIKPRYQSSSLSDTKALDIFASLNSLFENEKTYLDPSLKLKDLANILRTNTRYLSQVVNMHTGGNILHFINGFRIREVKRKIMDAKYAHLTTFGIAQYCGFKNKSTFYKVFREFEGVTPKDYIRQKLESRMES